jgi:prophage maintenance system killer protein
MEGAFELVRLFLQVNGYELEAKPEEVYSLLLETAASSVSVADVDAWIARNLTELEDD